MKTISIEFCLVTFLLIFIFLINILHIIYLIIYKHNKQIKSIRLILINSSLSSLIVSIWLIPFFYFRLLWSSESIFWRLWSYIFHIIDTVQLYSLVLIITTHSFQRIFIFVIWLIPIIAYSPLLWLTSPYDIIDYLPYRRLIMNVPWWILPILYFSMYILPLIISLILSSIHICSLLISSYYKKQKKRNISSEDINEHHKDMIELTDLITTVFNFQLEQSTTNQSNRFNKWISSFSNIKSKNVNHSFLSSKVCQHERFFLFDELLTSPLIHSSSNQTNNCIEQPFNSYLLFIITCLLLLVHLPYIVLSFIHISSFQLSIFIYFHWFGTLFLPMIHIK